MTIYIIEDVNEPCLLFGSGNKIDNKYQVKTKKIGGAKAIIWLVDAGLMYFDNQDHLKWTNRYKKWKNRKHQHKDLFWQVCSKGQPQPSPFPQGQAGARFKGNCVPTKSGRIDDPRKINIKDSYCPDDRYIKVWVDRSQAMGSWCKKNKNGTYRANHKCEIHCICQGKQPESDFDDIRVE